MNNFLKWIHKEKIRLYNFNDIRGKEYLGEGASGEVYKCTISGDPYAIKKTVNYDYTEIKDELKLSLNFIKSFRQMKIFGVCIDNKHEDVYLVMELLDNEGCLYEYLEKNRNLQYEERKAIFLSIVKAVRELHSMGIIHADIKPDNIVYYKDYKNKKKYTKLIDYNCSFYIGNETYDMEYACGTYGYCAPEQFNGYICLKSDIYSLGVIWLELLTDGDLWTSDNNYQKSRKEIMKGLDNLKNKDIRNYEIIKKCLTYSPTKRLDSNSLFNHMKDCV
jgi:serine/threonine protein kinase